MLKLIPDTNVNVIARCSGHGGAWGIQKENFEVAVKVGKPVARQVAKIKPKYLVSECPLAREHIIQGINFLEQENRINDTPTHPIELLALAYSD